MSIQEQISGLPDPEYRVLKNWLQTVEEPRRVERSRAETIRAETIRNLRDTGVLPAPPKEWQNPGSDPARMYLHGDRVEYENEEWESQHLGLNFWKPGENTAWVKITPTVSHIIEAVDEYGETVVIEKERE